VKNAIHFIASRACCIGAKGIFCLCVAAVLAGCATPRVNTVLVYDFGPGSVAPMAHTRLAPLVLAEVGAPTSLDTTAVLYRLGYADGNLLQPYAQARWSMPPAQLLRQHLRSALSPLRPVLHANEGIIPAAGTLVLRLELEEFSQLFDSVQSSKGLLRLRATLTQTAIGGETLLAQRSVLVSSPAATPDAAGGVRALAASASAAVLQLEDWIRQTEEALPARL
jgi:cholesterol transport system auxiliary component